MTEIKKQVDAIVKEIEADAYRRGWQDAMTALRKVALQVRYSVAPFGEYDAGAVIDMNNLSIGYYPHGR